MRAFFTVVKSQWPNEKSKKGGWPWMDFSRPQRVPYHFSRCFVASA